MVFSSVPLYLDPPNWQQPSDQHQVGDSRQNETTHHHLLHQQHPQHLPILPPLPQQQHQTNGVLPSSQIPTSAATTSSPTSTTSNRPTSMSERARLAKMIPQHAPDGGPLKCPRCESTNTKFCYFNNYSLSQPRHFCKTCRRYWTLGGALRNVPVGGGCRRNNSKRCSKGASGSRLKSPAVSNTSVSHEEQQQQQQSVGQHGGGNISSTALLSQFAGLNNNCSNVNPPSQFSFMGSLQNLTAQLGIGSSGNNLGLGMRFDSNGRIDQMGQLDFGGILQQQQQHAQHQQQQQQLPLLSGFGLYPFQNETTTTTTSMYGGGRGSTVPEMFITRPPKTSESVKMEEMQGGIQLGHHPSLSKEQQLSSGEQSTDHHHPQDHNRSSGTPHLWVGNNNSANNNNNINSNSNGLVSATSANNLWTDLSGLN